MNNDKMTIRYPFYPDYKVPPGWTLKEIMEDLHISPCDMAKKLKIEMNDLDKLLNGELTITEDLSCLIEEVTRVSSNFWMNLERNYRQI